MSEREDLVEVIIKEIRSYWISGVINSNKIMGYAVMIRDFKPKEEKDTTELYHNIYIILEQYIELCNYDEDRIDECIKKIVEEIGK